MQTLTSLGYGDFPVQTIAGVKFTASTYKSLNATSLSGLAGKLIGSLCAVCGILVMALPIPIVVDNFADYYQEQKKLEAAELKAEAAVEEEEWRGEQHLTAMQGLAETIRTTDLSHGLTAPVLSIFS